GFNSIPGVNEYFAHLAVKWCFDGVLHLHSLRDDDDIPFLEFISCLEFDRADRTRHLGTDMAEVSRISLFQFRHFGLDIFILDIYFSRESVKFEVHPAVAVLMNMSDRKEIYDECLALVNLDLKDFILPHAEQERRCIKYFHVAIDRKS